MNTLIILAGLLTACHGTEAEFQAGLICPADQCGHACTLTDSGRILRRVYRGGGADGFWIEITPVS